LKVLIFVGLLQGRFYVGAGGAQAPPNVGQAPQIFWFQQQKYVFLKSRRFLYSGEINTRISLCISNDEVTDQISALSKSCYSLIRNSLARTVCRAMLCIARLLPSPGVCLSVRLSRS